MYTLTHTPPGAQPVTTRHHSSLTAAIKAQLILVYQGQNPTEVRTFGTLLRKDLNREGSASAERTYEQTGDTFRIDAPEETP